MTLLRDVRLLLIIGLAILCLIALKMCSSTYEPLATGDTSSTGVVAETAEKVGETVSPASEGTATADATENSGDVVESEEVTKTEEATETADTSEDSTAVADETKTTLEETDSKEIIAEAAPAEDTATGDAATDDTATEETATEVASTESTQSEDTVTDKEVTAQIQSVVPTVEPVMAAEIEPIVLRDMATSGEFMPDFTTDIESVQDGLTQYTEKLDAAKTLLDKLKGVSE